MIRYLKAQMSLMEAAVTLADAEEVRAEAKDNYYADDSHTENVQAAASALTTSAHAFAVECRRITGKE